MVTGTAKIWWGQRRTAPSNPVGETQDPARKTPGSGSHVGSRARNPLGTLKDQCSSWILMCLVSFRSQSPNDHRHKGNDDGIPEPGIDIPRLGHDCGGEGRQHATEPPIADVVGQRHGGIANPRREELNEERSDGTVDHGHVDDHDDEDLLGHEPVHSGAVGLRRILGPP